MTQNHEHQREIKDFLFDIIEKYSERPSSGFIKKDQDLVKDLLKLISSYEEDVKVSYKNRYLAKDYEIKKLNKKIEDMELDFNNKLSLSVKCKEILTVRDILEKFKYSFIDENVKVGIID